MGFVDLEMFVDPFFGVSWCFLGGFWHFQGGFFGISLDFLASPFSWRRLARATVVSLLRFPPNPPVLRGVLVQNWVLFAHTPPPPPGLLP